MESYFANGLINVFDDIVVVAVVVVVIVVCKFCYVFVDGVVVKFVLDVDAVTVDVIVGVVVVNVVDGDVIVVVVNVTHHLNRGENKSASWILLPEL